MYCLQYRSYRSPEHPIRLEVEEQVRSYESQPGSPTRKNRAFSGISSPTYSIHQPENPNGVGLVICPGGGFRDIWIDREGHDLAIWLKDHGVTSLVLKYRTRPAEITSREMWQNYQNAVQADGGQAIRIMREQAKDLGLDPHKIGICGFSAGGHLAISCTLYGEPKTVESKVSGMRQ
jgi:acetyl esterase/lipase